MSNPHLQFALVPRDELGAVLRATGKPIKQFLGPSSMLPRVGSKEVIVVWSGGAPRPCAIAAGESNRLELYNWATSFHTDLSPLSSWCHVVAPDDLRPLSEGALTANLHGLEAAWTGVVIAEAMWLSGRGYEDLTQLTCFATDSFVMGRLAALYGPDAASDKKLEVVSKAHERLRPSSVRRRSAMSGIWRTLVSLMPGSFSPGTTVGSILQKACSDLNQRSVDGDKAPELRSDTVTMIASVTPPLTKLRELPQMSAEERVVYLREIRDQFPKGERNDDVQLMAFAAGYIISRIGGGQRDLRLAEAFEPDAPDVRGWAAMLGGLGHVPAWTDAYDGLGRLVSRELMRSFHLADPPTCDGAAEEVLVIVEPDRSSTRSRVRTGHRNVAALSLMPGVVAYLSTSEEEREKARASSATFAMADPLSLVGQDPKLLKSLASQLWPHLRPLVSSELSKRDKHRKKSTKPSSETPPLLKEGS